MTATLTALGVLVTSAYEHYEQDVTGERADTTYSIDGVRVRLDATGSGASLHAGQDYEVGPNDGYYIDRVGIVEVGARHFGHLVDADGRPTAMLPTTDGPLTLRRDRRYLLRQADAPRTQAWTVYEFA